MKQQRSRTHQGFTSLHLALLRKPGRDAGLRPFKSSLHGKAIQRLQFKFVQTFLKNFEILLVGRLPSQPYLS